MQNFLVSDPIRKVLWLLTFHWLSPNNVELCTCSWHNCRYMYIYMFLHTYRSIYKHVPATSSYGYIYMFLAHLHVGIYSFSWHIYMWVYIHVPGTFVLQITQVIWAWPWTLSLRWTHPLPQKPQRHQLCQKLTTPMICQSPRLTGPSPTYHSLAPRSSKMSPMLLKTPVVRAQRNLVRIPV